MNQKKSLMTILMALATATVLGADLIGSPIYPDFTLNTGQSFIPASFTKAGSPMLTFSNFNAETGAINLQIADASLQIVADLDIPANPDALSESTYSNDMFTMHWTSVERDTLDKKTFDLNAYIEEHEYTLVAKYITSLETSDGVVWANEDTSYEVLPDGFRAIKQFLIEAKDWVLVTCGGECEVTTSVNYLENSSGYGVEPLKSVFCYDYDMGVNSLGRISATQTLFNDDEEFEYIYPLLSRKESSDGTDNMEVDYGYLYDFGDFAYQNRNFIYTSSYPESCIGFDIKNQKGEILQTIHFEEGLHANPTDSFMSLIIIGGIKYLSCSLTDGRSHYMVLYAINKNGTGVMQVASFQTNVHPTVIERGENVIVDTDGVKALSVEAYDMSGKVLFKGRLNSGEDRMTIPASLLSDGMNVVTVSDGLQKSSTKVLVK